MPQPLETGRLDQTQDVIQLEGRTGLLAKAPHVQPDLTIEQPMPCHCRGQTEQQIEIQIRAQHQTHVAALFADTLIAIDRPVVRLQHFQGGDQQAAGGELGAGIDQHEPIDVDLPQSAVDALQWLFRVQTQKAQLGIGG
ncbi:hypothetical protein D3C81_1804510 [compost metagenome]